MDYKINWPEVFRRNAVRHQQKAAHCHMEAQRHIAGGNLLLACIEQEEAAFHARRAIENRDDAYDTN